MAGGKSFSDIPAVTSAGKNDEFLMDNNGNVKRITRESLIGSVSAEIRSDIVSLRDSVSSNTSTINALSTRLDAVSIIAQDAGGGGISSLVLQASISGVSIRLQDQVNATNTALTSVQAMVSKTSVALRDDITSLRAAKTSVQAMVSKTSVALRDDIVSLREQVSKVSILAQAGGSPNALIQASISGVSIRLQDQINTTNTALTSVQAMVSKTSVALRDDVVSLRDQVSKVSLQLGATSTALSDRINTNLAALTSVQALVSKTSVALRDDVTSLRALVSKVSIIAQDAAGGGITSLILQASISGVSIRLQDEINVNTAAITSVQAMVSKTSVALRDDIVSLREQVSKVSIIAQAAGSPSAEIAASISGVSIRLQTEITKNLNAITSVQAMVSKTSVALRDDITSLRAAKSSVDQRVSKVSTALSDRINTNLAAITSVQAMVSKTSVALRDDITSLRAAKSSVDQRVSKVSLQLGATSTALSDRITTNLNALTSVQAMVSKTSVALRDDIVSLREQVSKVSIIAQAAGAVTEAQLTSVQAMVSKTSVALRDDITSLRAAKASVNQRTSVLYTKPYLLVSPPDSDFANERLMGTSTGLQGTDGGAGGSYKVHLRLNSLTCVASITPAGHFVVLNSSGLGEQTRHVILPVSTMASIFGVIGGYSPGTDYSDAITSVQAMVSKVSLQLGATSTALSDRITTNLNALTSVQAMVSKTSVALRDDITSIRSKHTSVASRVANSVARLDAANNFQGFGLAAYTLDVQTTNGSFTAISANSGAIMVMTNAASAFVNLDKTMPLGWNMQLLQLGSGVVVVSAQASTSLVNASAHTKLNNYGSGAVLTVVKQEGTNSHAWYWLQGETEA